MATMHSDSSDEEANVFVSSAGRVVPYPFEPLASCSSSEAEESSTSEEEGVEEVAEGEAPNRLERAETRERVVRV